MESWMISLAIAICASIATFITIKNSATQNAKDIEKIQETSIQHKREEDKLHIALFEKIDKANETLAEHKVKLGASPTMENVRAEFVSKEMFKQMEKHIDEKFDKLESGIEKILDKSE